MSAELDLSPAIEAARQAVANGWPDWRPQWFGALLADAVVRAAAPLIEAEVRRKVAQEIRTQEPPRIPTGRGTFVSTYSTREWAARIAESGGQP